MTKIKTKFKHTEIGWIPVDWEIAKLNQYAYFYSGGTPDTNNPLYYSGNIPWITSSDLNKKVIKEVDNYISELGLKMSSAKLVDNGTILLALYGATSGQVAITNIKAAINQAVLAIILKQNLDKFFLFHYLQFVKKNITEKYCQGGQPNLSAEIIKDVLIPLPPLHEQQAIAEVLSDIDTIIEKMDKLIQKKINIKNATMHLLLSGKKRLPGFKGDWVRKKIKDLLQYERPDKYIVKSEEYYQHGRTPVLTANKSFLLGFTDENFGIYYNIPVIIFDDFTTESKYVDFPFKVKSSAIKILRQRNNECNLKFIYELMQMIIYPIGDHKRYYITEYQNIEVLVPAIKEQQAIAQVLSDMDKEIDALQKRKNKLTHIKQAAMHLLLTGKVRLIHPSQNSPKTKQVSQNTTHA
jgi:type I restriction enzyme S subunit